MSIKRDSTLILQTYQLVGSLINTGVLQMKHGALDEAGKTFKIGMDAMKELGSEDIGQITHLQQAREHTKNICTQLHYENKESYSLNSVEISFNFFDVQSVQGYLEQQSPSEWKALCVDTTDFFSYTNADADIFCAILIYNLAVLYMLKEQQRMQGTSRNYLKQLSIHQLLSLSIELLQGYCCTQHDTTFQLLSPLYILSLAYSNILSISNNIKNGEDTVHDLEYRLKSVKEDLHNISSETSTALGCCLLIKNTAAAA